MAFVWDTMTAINLVLCTAIVALGYWSYKKQEDVLPLYIGAAFGLFAVSHVATLLGLKDVLTGLLILVRTMGYLAVVYALYLHWKK